MRKLILLGLSSLFLSVGVINAQNDYSKTASTELYDFKSYTSVKVLDLFKDVLSKGRNFPTDEEFEAALGENPAFIRSHVRRKDVLRGDDNKYLHSSLREGRSVFMNIPCGVGKGTGGYQSDIFDNDPYSMWQYTELFGSWNHGFFQAPGSFGDAAHKHGVDYMSGITFFDTTGGRGEGSGSYEALISKRNPDGTFVYVKPLINALMYLGLDGINYNWEDQGYTNPNVVAFHKALREYADEVGFTNYRQAIYTSAQSLNDGYAAAWLWDSARKKYIGDIMLNYSGGNFADTGGWSATKAYNLTGSYDHLYSGVWIVGMASRAWNRMENVETNLCLWGEHAMSRFVSYNSGSSSENKMANYQKLYENAFSGGSRNPAIKDSWSGNNDWNDRLTNFGGISRMIPERTSLSQDLPFRTYFNTGAGERYYYKGKTSLQAGWYDMGAQDYQPTYRWLQYKQGTTEAVQPVISEFAYDDAYVGGTSLRLKGQENVNNVDLILFRGKLNVTSANAKAKVALKSMTTDYTSHLSLIVHKKGAAATEYNVYKLADLQGKTWEEQEVVMSDIISGDVIDLIGLRVGDITNSYDMLVGEIGLFDDATSVKPSAPKDIKVEVKKETRSSMAVKLSWHQDALPSSNPARKNFGLIFNDEAGVNHFEILYKNGENGTPREVARTASWSTFIPTIVFSDDETPYYGVRAVAPDLKTFSDVTWIAVERAEAFELPDYKSDKYCSSEIDRNAAGYDVAITSRFLQEIKTTGAVTDLSYTRDNPGNSGTNYYDETSYVFKVKQGQTFNLFFKAYTNSDKDDGLKWCWGACYIDWNGNGIFEPEDGEQVLDLGRDKAGSPEFQNPGVTRTIRVPERAKRGEELRVRFVFTDAWFSKPTPCGLTSKGYTADFSVIVEGDNDPEPYVDPHDQGDPELPEGISPVKETSVEVITNTVSRVYPNPVKDVLYLDNVDKAWVFTMDGRMIRFVSGQSNINVSDLPKGNYVVKTQKENITRAHKVVKE